MKLFVYEHITSGSLIDDPLPDSLAHEGDKMLQALLNDLIQLPYLQLIILRDSRLTQPDSIDKHQCYVISTQAEFQKYYALAMDTADAMLPIAPETGNTLCRIQQSVLDAHKKLLACSPEASLLCSDKLRCYQHLSLHNLTSPTTVRADKWIAKEMNTSVGYITKPIDGAGCLNTLFFSTTGAVESHLSTSSISLESLIIQPYIQGLNISLTILCSDQDCLVLAANQQHIQVEHNQLVFNGCTVNNINISSGISSLAQRVYQAIPGLWGFIGIDLIVSENDMIIVDINPRLTTSYIGLAPSLGLNPAELLFSMMQNGLSSIPPLLQRHPIEVEI